MRHSIRRSIPTCSVSSLVAALACASAAALATSSTLVAQVAARPFDASAVVDAACGVRTVDDQVVADGPGYVATLAADGATYTPALGERAPRTLPLHLQLLAIGRGDDLAPVPTVAPRATADGATYARGRGVRERFAATARGLALSLAFPARPAGRGDLVVRYRLDGDLARAASPTPTGDGGMRLVQPGSGGVTIGGVTGIGADGQRCTGSLRWAGTHLDLVLPGSFVDGARYPLLLDPLIGTEAAYSTAAVDTEPEVAYASALGRYLVVWRRTFSFTDSRIVGQFVDGTSGAAVGSLVIVDRRIITPSLRLHPTVAFNGTRMRFLVAWQESTSMFGPFVLQLVAIDANGTATVPLAASTAGGSREEPALSSSKAAATAILVWTEPGLGIRGCPVTISPTGSPALGPAVPLGNARADEHSPALSRGQNDNGAFLLAWIGDGPPARVEADSLQVGVNLTAGGGIVVTTTTAGESIGNLDADGDGTQFVVAWDQTDSQSAFTRDVHCRLLHWDTTTALVAVGGTVPQAVTPGDDTHDPAVAFLGPKFAIAWVHGGSSSASSAIEGRDLSLACTPCSRPWSLQARAGHLQGTPSFGTEIGGGLADDDALLLCTDATPAALFNGSIHGSLFSAFGSGGAITVAGSGCGSAGTMTTAGGPLALGNSSFRLELTGAPAGSVAVANVGIPGNEIVCGSCTITNGLVMLPVAPTGAVFRLGLPVSCKPFYVGATLSAQWLVVSGTAAPCPIARGLSASSRLHLTIGE